MGGRRSFLKSFGVECDLNDGIDVKLLESEIKLAQYVILSALDDLKKGKPTPPTLLNTDSPRQKVTKKTSYNQRKEHYGSAISFFFSDSHKDMLSHWSLLAGTSPQALQAKAREIRTGQNV